MFKVLLLNRLALHIYLPVLFGTLFSTFEVEIENERLLNPNIDFHILFPRESVVVLLLQD